MNGALPDRRSLNEWWSNRAIPASRSGIREALEAMNVSDTKQLILKCYRLSLSDHYWINPDEQPLDWDKINFFDNAFSEDAGNILFGKPISKDNLDLVSPDNTSDGRLKKKWKISDGKRVLVKGGSNPYQQEPINEAVISLIHKRLRAAAYVPYSVVWEDGLPYSVCENFVTKEMAFVSARRIYLSRKRPNHRSSYEHFLDCCGALGIPGMREFLDYQFATDFAIANTDRHLGNFGAIRSADTLEWLGPAPIFDSGTSLWHDRLPQSIRSGGDAEAKPFKSKHSEQILLVGSLDMIDFSALDGLDDEFREILSPSPFIDSERVTALCRGLAGRIERLRRIAEQRMENPPQGFTMRNWL